jgi:hypothetical protein
MSYYFFIYNKLYSRPLILINPGKSLKIKVIIKILLYKNTLI